jgi:hypothetical protein
MPRRVNGSGRDRRRGCKKKPGVTAGFSPLNQRKAQNRRVMVMPRRTGVGVVKVIVWYGWDPGQKKWGCPTGGALGVCGLARN